MRWDLATGQVSIPRAGSVLVGIAPEASRVVRAAMDLGEPLVVLEPLVGQVGSDLEDLPAGWDPPAAAPARPGLAAESVAPAVAADWDRVRALAAAPLQDRQGSHWLLRRDFRQDHLRDLR